MATKDHYLFRTSNKMKVRYILRVIENANGYKSHHY